MTFTGEALGLYGAANVAGGAITDGGDALHYLHRDTTTVTAGAGQSFTAGIDPSPYLLEPGDAAVCSWVVEFTAGSSGTVHLSDGLDPTFDYTDPAPLTNDLGTHTVTGASRLAVDTGAVTAADILAGTTSPALHVQVTAGTVTIAQIRLRVWPPDGPTGAWASGAPGYTATDTGSRYAAQVTANVYGYSGPADAWSAASSGFTGGGGSSQTWQEYSSGSRQSLAKVDQNIETEPTNPNNWGSTLSVSSVLYLWTPSLVTFPSTAGGINPDVVPGDAQWQARAAGGGNLYETFAGWVGDITIAPPTVVGAAGTTVYLSQAAADPAAFPTTGLDTRAGPWPYPAGGVPVGSTAPLADLPCMVVTATTSGHYAAPGGELEEVLEVTYPAPTLNVTVADHEWWDPTLPWQGEEPVELTPRFFVKDREGVWRPVGFGRPADETSVFRVPTPLGWYRDLTTAEAALYPPDTRPPLGYPLKVKREDGTWDHVAWMVPE